MQSKRKLKVLKLILYNKDYLQAQLQEEEQEEEAEVEVEEEEEEELENIIKIINILVKHISKNYVIETLYIYTFNFKMN